MEIARGSIKDQEFLERAVAACTKKIESGAVFAAIALDESLEPWECVINDDGTVRWGIRAYEKVIGYGEKHCQIHRYEDLN